MNASGQPIVDKDGTVELDYDLATPNMLLHYFPTGILGLGLTALLASFMSGMAGNVTAFNTVWTYDIYQSYINKKASDRALPVDGPHGDDLRHRAVHCDRLHGHAVQQHHGHAATGVRFRECPAVRHVPAGHVLEAHHRPRSLQRTAGRYDGGRTPSRADAAARGVPGVKGGWIATMHVYPSEMAQNFWTAIYAWTTCFVITIVISLLTRAHDEKELTGLVYSLTERPTQQGLSWYQRPVVLAVVVLAATALLNIVFR